MIEFIHFCWWCTSKGREVYSLPCKREQINVKLYNSTTHTSDSIFGLYTVEWLRNFPERCSEDERAIWLSVLCWICAGRGTKQFWKKVYGLLKPSSILHIYRLDQPLSWRTLWNWKSSPNLWIMFPSMILWRERWGNMTTAPTWMENHIHLLISHVIHRELSVSLHSMLCLILPIHSETASLASLKDTLVMKEVSTSVSRRSSTGSFREKVTNYSSFLWRTIQTIKPPMAMDVVCVVCFTL